MTIDFPNDPRGRELLLLVRRAAYERWLVGKSGKILEEEWNRITDLILSREWRTLTQFQRDRALQLYGEIERQLKVGYVNVKDLHLREMQGYAGLESEIARAQVGSMLSEPTAAVQRSLGAFLPRHTVASIAKLPIDGLRLGEWFDGQARSMSLATRRVIQSGLVQGKGPAEIVRQIIGPRGSTEPSVFRRARNEATVITRTTVNTVQNHAAQLSYEKLPGDVSNSYRLLAVRDHRTSTICRALDGKVFRYDDPKKKVPPFHLQCRTGTIPVIAGVTLTPMSFASYNDWLRAQNTSTQNDILGATRAYWWRSGRMTLADAIDDDNRVLTLTQLRAKLGIEEMAGAA